MRGSFLNKARKRFWPLVQQRLISTSTRPNQGRSRRWEDQNKGDFDPLSNRLILTSTRPNQGSWRRWGVKTRRFCEISWPDLIIKFAVDHLRKYLCMKDILYEWTLDFIQTKNPFSRGDEAPSEIQSDFHHHVDFDPIGVVFAWFWV